MLTLESSFPSRLFAKLILKSQDCEDVGVGWRQREGVHVV